jgi:hypothetical protein
MKILESQKFSARLFQTIVVLILVLISAFIYLNKDVLKKIIEI